jgi:hypothetical protein
MDRRGLTAVTWLIIPILTISTFVEWAGLSEVEFISAAVFSGVRMPLITPSYSGVPMKYRITGAVLSLSLLLLTFSAVAYAGGGHSASQLERAGWFCINTGPHNWVHCFPPGAFASSASVTVKVFDVTGSPFLGTELLIRADLYGGQPCAQDGGDDYGLLPAAVSGLPVDYRACHHFDTG